MAFDAATNSSRGSRKPGLPTSEAAGSLVEVLSQKLWNLAQTLAVIDKLVDQLGSRADTTTARSRLQAAEAKADALRGELDTGLRRLRVEVAEKGDSYTSKSVERLADQYGELRRRLVDTVKTSQAKQRQHVPHDEEQRSPTVVSNKFRDEHIGVELSNLQLQGLQGLSDVDEAIAEERRAAAAALAYEAVEVHGVVRDIGGLVQQQGEVLNKVEEHVDTTKDNVIRANTDLITAAKYQASYRKKCAFFILLLLIIVAIIVIPILIHVVPSTSSDSNSNGGGGSSPGPGP